MSWAYRHFFFHLLLFMTQRCHAQNSQLVKEGHSNQKPGKQHLLWHPRKRNLCVSTSFSPLHIFPPQLSLTFVGTKQEEKAKLKMPRISPETSAPQVHFKLFPRAGVWGEAPRGENTLSSRRRTWPLR